MDTAPRPVLRPTQLAALLLLAAGQSRYEMAQELNYSEERVKQLVRELRALLGAKNSTEAVARALRAGVIE